LREGLGEGYGKLGKDFSIFKNPLMQGSAKTPTVYLSIPYPSPGPSLKGRGE
jgi:hypothetical protein